MIVNSRQYNTLHQNLLRHRRKSGTCEHCKKTKKTDWADKNGKYVYDRNEWLELCRSCHVKYDLSRTTKRRGKDKKPRKQGSGVYEKKV